MSELFDLVARNLLWLRTLPWSPQRDSVIVIVEEWAAGARKRDENDQFRVGDAVFLNCGGSREMIVTHSPNPNATFDGEAISEEHRQWLANRIEVAWHDDGGRPMNGTYPRAALRRA